MVRSMSVKPRTFRSAVNQLVRFTQLSVTTWSPLTLPFPDVGGNPSAEGGEDEGTDDAAQTVLDVVAAMRLQQFGTMEKDEYKDHLKGTYPFQETSQREQLQLQSISIG